MTTHPGNVQVLEHWLRHGRTHSIAIAEPVTMAWDLDTVPDGSVNLDGPRTVDRRAVRFGSEDAGWTLMVAVDRETSEPLAVQALEGWVTW